MVFNRYLDDHTINCIVMNDAAATEQTVAYLYDLGHRQIAHLPDLLHTAVGRDQTNAYCGVMLQRGLAPWVLAAAWTIEEGMAVTETLLSARKLPTAIGAMHVLRRAGLRV